MNRTLQHVFTITILFFSFYLGGQTYDWQWATSSTGNHIESANCVTTDASGNVIVAGYYYSDTVSFGNDTLLNKGNFDLLIVKYDPSGNVLWARGGGGIYDDLAHGVTTDQSGNVYLTGQMYSPTLVLGTTTLTGLGSGDVFCVKYNSAGTLVWAKLIGGGGDDGAAGITCDQSGNLCITGYFKSLLFTAGTHTLSTSGKEDVFIVKMDENGNSKWARSFSGTGTDKATCITSDALNNIFIAGVYSSPFFYSSNYTVSPVGSSEVFIAKVDSNGTSLWINSAGGIYNDEGHAITTDIQGNIIVAGVYNSPSFIMSTDTLDHSGGFDFFVAKYNNSGSLLWVRKEGNIFDDTAYGVATDGSSNIYVTGHTHSPSLILGTDTIITQGTGDFYLLAYNASGNFSWSKSVGGIEDDGSSALTIDLNGNLFVAGYFRSAVLNDPNFSLSNSGQDDLFLGKLNPNQIITDVPEKHGLSSIQIFPNPSEGIFTIDSKEAKYFSTEIFNDQGQLIYTHNVAQQSSFTIDLSTVSRGIYIIKLQSESATLVKKLVIR